MKKLFRPASLLFNILCLLVFFIMGIYFAGLIDAGKNQGLAGGAIVLGWGVLFAGIAFIISFFITYKVEHRKIVIANWILFALLLTGYGITHYRFVQRDKLQKEENKPYQKKSTTPTKIAEPTAMLLLKERDGEVPIPSTIEEPSMGMGFFAPNYYENPTLYFYGNLNLEKSLMDHTPYDSITFKINKFNSYEIATAPPWLVPDHFKLDYDMLYFKIESVTEEFVEVVVNAQNNQTSYLSKRSGKVVYWPEFLLGVNSIEFAQGSAEKVRARPFEVSGEINTPYQFMKPIKVKGEWAEVLLLDGGFQKVGKGWVQWKKDNTLLIIYNLLS
ncbi:MAG: hypothetical protein R2781_07775 [Flavobacteriaceae bacterium]